jgi:hypothetical protein
VAAQPRPLHPLVGEPARFHPARDPGRVVAFQRFHALDAGMVDPPPAQDRGQFPAITAGRKLPRLLASSITQAFRSSKPGSTSSAAIAAAS